jgi:hypothetical protein
MLDRAQMPDAMAKSNLIQLGKASAGLDRLEQILKEQPQNMGPIAGRLSAMNPWRDPAQQRLISGTAQMFVEQMSAQGGLARTTDNDMKLMKKASAGENLTPSQNAEVVAAMRRSIDKAVPLYAGVYNSQEWWKGKESLLGKRYEPIIRQTVFGAGKVETPPSDAAFMTELKANTEKGMGTVVNGVVWKLGADGKPAKVR